MLEAGQPVAVMDDEKEREGKKKEMHGKYTQVNSE